MLRRKSELLWLIFFFVSFPVLADPLNYWDDAANKSTGNSLFSFASGNGVNVAVGEWGTVLTSLDGTHWKNRSLQIHLPFRSIGFGNGRFIATATEGFDLAGGTSSTHFLSSIDGENWRRVHTHQAPVLFGRTEWIRKVIYANGLFVAVGGCSARSGGPSEITRLILISSDGESWEKVLNVPGSALLDIEYIRGKFYAVGQDRLFMTSVNGRDWTTSSITEFGDLADIEETSEGWAILANTGWYNTQSFIYTSTNAVDWERKSTISEYAFLRALIRCGDDWLALGEAGKSFASPDLVNWRSVSLPPTSEIQAVGYISNKCAIIGTQGLIVLGETVDQLTVAAHRPPSFVPYSIAFGKGKYVVTGNLSGVIGSSMDAVSWTLHPFQPINSLPVHKVVYGNGIFLASGLRETVYRSEDGEHWELVHQAGPIRTWSIAWNGSVFAAVDEGGTHVSTNGRDWTQTTTMTMTGLIAGDGKFLAHGTDDDPNLLDVGLYLSTNGVNWERVFDLPWPTFVGAYGNGRFVLRIEDSNALLISEDGRNFQRSEANLPRPDLGYAGGRFIAFGATGWIASSTDGLSWVPHLVPDPVPISMVVERPDHILLGTAVGTMLKSGPLSVDHSPLDAIEIATDGKVQIQLRGRPGATYHLESSTNLVNWHSEQLIYSEFGRSRIEFPKSSSTYFKATPAQ